MQAALHPAAPTCSGRHQQQRHFISPTYTRQQPKISVAAAAEAAAPGGAAAPQAAAAAAPQAAEAAAGSDSDDDFLELPEAVHSMAVPDFNPDLVPQLRKHFDTRCDRVMAGKGQWH